MLATTAIQTKPRRGRLARSFAFRFDNTLEPPAIVIGIETTAGVWWEVPMDHDQAIEFVDELAKLLARHTT